ncbi:cytochrome P450 [Bisporella sp. PMI_857]|nr:cytochrome P450 [Bisporella sp. PMI_857]
MLFVYENTCVANSGITVTILLSVCGHCIRVRTYIAHLYAFFHPLAKAPGLKIWAASRLPYIRSLITGNLVHDVEKLHQKYGPVVRRPGHLPFVKDPIWWAKQAGRAEPILSAGDYDHTRLRKLLHHGFTPRALREQEPMIQAYVALLIKRLRELPSEPFDIAPWFNFTTFDIFGEIGFGESFDCLQHSKYHPWISLLFNSVKAACFIISARFCPLINTLLMWCIPKHLNWEIQQPDLMSYIIKYNDEKEGMVADEVQHTFMQLTTTGSKTTATVLCGTTNYLINHPEKLDLLVREVRGTFTREAEMTLDALSKLLYLNAVINEGLRLCPPVPVMLARLVPPGGDNVCGTWLPAGSWSQFRDPKYFHQSIAFIPERWLPEAEQASILPFSTGPRSCIGKNLAWAEMRLIMARLVWAFDIEGSGKPLRWATQKTFLLVEKQPILVKI